MWEWFEARYSVQALWSAWGAIVLGYVGFLILERLVPAQRHPDRREIGTDVRMNLIFIIMNPVALFLGAWLANPVAVFIGGPQLRLGLAEIGSEPVSGFILAFIPFLVFDFFYYWFHRFQHEWPWLWEVHRLHHSERVLNVTTNFRHHWLEEFFRTFIIFLPMNWLVAIDPTSSALAAVLIGQWSNFFHANIRLSLGPITPLVTGPQYHRIHHSIESKHVNKNYAAFFPVWDWIFRTYWRPRSGEWPGAGLTDTDGIWSMNRILFSPFIRWWRCWRCWGQGRSWRREA
jgi:sterol desaturase/sphingolipid hydroxylase (fatty acid hydroxylase superfamily)